MLFAQKPRKKNFLAALDLGGTKVCCSIAKLSDGLSGENLKIIGLGYQLSKGFKGGIVTHANELEESILNAVHTAEQMAGETVSGLYVNISASMTRSYTLEVQMALDNQVVEGRHVRDLMATGRRSFEDPLYQVIHVFPLAYALDQAKGIQDPRGLVGQTLSASLHIVCAPTSLMDNLSNCVARSHLDIEGFVVAPYAAGLSVLHEDELDLGVTLVDIGGTGVGIASFLGGALVYIDSVPLGGSHITNDIARGLSTPLIQAERIKTLYGTTIFSSSDEGETILVPQLGEGKQQAFQQVQKTLLTQIVRARVEETLELIWSRLQQSGMDRLVCQRIVLTGGGSQLPGLRELACHLWGRQTIRLGIPQRILGASDVVTMPMFSVCAGLLQFALRDHMGAILHQGSAHGSNSLWKRLSLWVRENF